MKGIQISDADLNYCVKHGIISKPDSRFFKSMMRSDSIEPRYRALFDNISGKLKYYSGITHRISVMKEQVDQRNNSLRLAKSVMRESYANLPYNKQV